MLAQAKEKEADNRRMSMIEDFYAQKEKAAAKTAAADPSHKYVQQVPATLAQAPAPAPPTNEHNQQMLFQ